MLTESLKFKKSAKDFDNIGNEFDFDHLIRKRRTGPSSHKNLAQGYFETGLRSYGQKRFKTGNLHSRPFWRYSKRDRKGKRLLYRSNLIHLI